ncbi:MAG: YbaB/EbfC family nucleoid-associated protein [Patescibacteria group bacterium]|jgi:DNA-binding protein YbaB|nr:YbaB/EbfC family nucleoid-associated protein [Patescibacteria group bacterium]
MFGKAKEQLDFVKKAREIQKKLKDEVITVESGAITIVINGEQKIQKVTINKEDVDVDRLDVLEKDIKTVIESAIKKSQEIAANLMKDMGGFPGM